MAWYGWRPYVSVAERRRKAARKMESLRRKGVDIQPVEIEGRKIAKTFWGEAWCEHLESFSDYENRLPRGRRYVRNGSVCHLAISKGKVEAKVSGSEIYHLRIKIKTLPANRWEPVKRRCAGQIGSLLELLQGHLSHHVMQVVTDRKKGLFPLPNEISFHCDCPDWAVMCKHVAAVLYGVGARLDDQPELLFKLRGVNHEELIDTDAEVAVSSATTSGKSKRLATDELSDVFGIDIEAGSADSSAPGKARKSPKRKATKKSAPRKRSTKTAGTKAAPKKPPPSPTRRKAVKKKAAAKKTTNRAAKKKASTQAKKTVAKKKPGRKRTVRTAK